MNRYWCTFTVGLVLCATAARAQEPQQLEGKWTFASLNVGGSVLDDARRSTLEVYFLKDEFELKGKVLEEIIKAKFTIDEKAKTFDFEPTVGPEKGKVSKGLYEFKVAKSDGGEKVTLRIYFAQPGSERPKKIEDKVVEGNFLWVLEKSK